MADLQQPPLQPRRRSTALTAVDRDCPPHLARIWHGGRERYRSSGRSRKAWLPVRGVMALKSLRSRVRMISVS